jgi:hypothetical protein
MEGDVRFVERKVLNDEPAPMIANSLITIVSTLAAKNYIVTALCIGSAWNDEVILNELYSFFLPRQA